MKKIFWILVVGLLFRLIALNQSLWLDEAISANVVKNYGFLDIVKIFSVNDFHPPLYYWVLKCWTGVFGLSEISLRLPSVIFSLITVYFVYLIGKKIKDEKTGLWAAILTGFNPLLIYYSQETRMYSLATMFLIISLYFFIKIIRNKKIIKKEVIFFNLFSFLSFASFYGSIFLLASFAIYFLIKKRFKLLFLTNIGAITAVLVLTPLLRVQIINSKLVLAQVENWKSVLGNVDFKNLLLFPIKFSMGRISFYPKKLYYLVAGIWSAIVFWPFLRIILKKKFWMILFFGPLILGVLFSLFSPLMQYFRFLYLIPIMCILLALEKNKIIKTIILGGFVVFSLIYLFNPVMHREDWKTATLNLKNTQEIYMIESFSDPLKYYLPEIKIKDLKTVGPEENIITVVPYGEAIHGINHQQILITNGYKLKNKENFREITIEQWQKLATVDTN